MEKAKQQELKASVTKNPEDSKDAHAVKGEAAEKELPPSSQKEIKVVLI
jgi:hypothetical protein